MDADSIAIVLKLKVVVTVKALRILTIINDMRVGKNPLFRGFRLRYVGVPSGFSVSSSGLRFIPT